MFCPYGCSDGDTTATANGTVSISAGTCVIDDTVGGNGSDYYAFDVSTDNLVSHDVNTVFIRFKVTTWVNDTDFFSYYGDANDFIRFKPVTADDINLQYVSSGVYVAISTSDATLAVGTEYIARVRWRTADVDPNLTINVYNTSMVEQGTGASSNTNPAGVDATAGASGWRIGNGFPDAVGGALIIYYVHSYKEWLDVDPNL